MKIGIVSPPLVISWGGHRQILELASELIRQWHEVAIFTPVLDREACFPEKTATLPIYACEEARPGTAAAKWRGGAIGKLLGLCSSWSKTRQFAKLIAKIDAERSFDVLNYHDVEIRMARFFPGKRNVWMMNDLPWINEGYKTAYADMPFFYRTAMLTSNVLHVRWVASLLRHISQTVVLDHRNVEIVQRLFGTDTTVIRSGIDQTAFLANEKNWGNDGKPFELLCTSIFFRHRRYEDVIRAVAVLKQRGVNNFVLNVIGRTDTDPGYYAEIRALVDEFELNDTVRFHGKVSEEFLRESYAKADIFLFPNAPQTWWLSVFEAMLSGCMAIITNGCGAHEILTDGETAMIVPMHDHDAIAQAIEKAMAQPEASKTIAKNGTAFVQKTLSWQKYASDMVSVFQGNTPIER